MTNAEFAQRCARIAANAAQWSADCLDVANEMRREPAERFIREMRERLDRLERDFNATPKDPTNE